MEQNLYKNCLHYLCFYYVEFCFYTRVGIIKMIFLQLQLIGRLYYYYVI